MKLDSPQTSNRAIDKAPSAPLSGLSPRNTEGSTTVEVGASTGREVSVINVANGELRKKSNSSGTKVTQPPRKDAAPLLCDPTFASLVKLDPVPDVSPLRLLSPSELSELETLLQIRGDNHKQADGGWRGDWSGNLHLFEKDLVMNMRELRQQRNVKPVLKTFHEWVAENTVSADDFRGVRLLFSHVYHMKDTPHMAQKLMAYALHRPASDVDERHEFILEAYRRISYDPIVLQQDGWTTAKAPSPNGSSGGAFLIGRKVLWSKYEAIVIAFVHDDGIGDLWKAMWIEDLETFDLEADELQDAMKKWDAKEARKKATATSARGPPWGPAGSGRSSSIRYASFADFKVKGVQHGVVLARSYHPKSRQGVMWPARIMHVSETKAGGSSQASRRSTSQKNVNVIFLAPFWNGSLPTTGSRGRGGTAEANGSTAKNIFSTGNLFEMESVEASDANIQKYPYENLEFISIDKIRAEFRFLGLPKAAFSRYLDSHRLAAALKAYASNYICNKTSTSVSASALTDCHALSIKTALFPPALLELPYDFILSQLPAPSEQASQMMGADGDDVTEPVLKLERMLKAMSPPECFGVTMDINAASEAKGRSRTPPLSLIETPQSGTPVTPAKVGKRSNGSAHCKAKVSVESIASEYLLKALNDSPGVEGTSSVLSFLGYQLSSLVSRLHGDAVQQRTVEGRREALYSIIKQCFSTKSYGEDLLQADAKAIPETLNRKSLTSEWRKSCERFYRRAVAQYSSPGYGNGVTAVITDSRCNQHLTAAGSYERAVRLPVAIRGAKRAGAGSDIGLPLVTNVKDFYLELAEKTILPKAHKGSYLKRIKGKIAALPPDTRGAPLTDDSEGDGGQDTQGSRGSYIAAITGVATALQGVDMVLGGACVSAFCALRPPGHHAGRELHAMNAVSNGFCLLNNAACAALYAVTPQSEGGPGVKRVCVIDFDVHHGNGTQDILCSTYDTRFLYVSLHAGGSQINGFEESGEDSDSDYGFRRSLGGGRQEGIFPGKCGDSSPHAGVLNLPLGQKVTSHAVGTALVTQVAPAVESFSPDLIILSAGFDAHKHDPLGMGGLSAEDFGSVTDVACQMAARSCSGRVLSLLEGGYGVPCCRPSSNVFLPKGVQAGGSQQKILDLSGDLPENMEDDIPPGMQPKLDKCYAEGFLDCVREHVGALSKSGKSRC